MFKGIKRFSFLIPALLTAALVFEMIPQTQVSLREIPERLQLIEEVEAKTSEPKIQMQSPAAIEPYRDQGIIFLRTTTVKYSMAERLHLVTMFLLLRTVVLLLRNMR